MAMNPASKNLLTSAKFNFTLEAFKKSAAIESKDNLFFSPHSLHEALTLAYFGARGTTEESLRIALQIPQEVSKIDVQRSYALERAYKNIQEQSVNISTSLRKKILTLDLDFVKQLACRNKDGLIL